MASPQLAYNKTAGSSSAKTLAFTLVARVKACTLHLRKRAVLEAMLGFNAFAALGSDNYLFPAQGTIAVALGLPYITVRRIIDSLQKDEVLVQIHSSNVTLKNGNGYEIRRPATYQVDASKLIARLTVKQYQEKHFGKRVSSPFRPAAATSAPTPAPTPVADPLPDPKQPKTNGHARRLPALTPRQRKELVRRIPIFMKGDGRGYQRSSDGAWIGPEHAEYRAPLSKQAAILEACKSMCESDGVSLEKAIEAAADAGFKVEPEGQA